MANSEFINTPKQFVLIVGQNPSIKNEDQYIAFKGTKSGKRLDEWIQKLDIQNGTIINASDTVGTVKLKDANVTQILHIIKYYPIDKVVALGNYASKVLNKLKISHYKLPHPSFRNLKNNSKEFVDSELEKCYNYLYGKEFQ